MADDTDDKEFQILFFPFSNP